MNRRFLGDTAASLAASAGASVLNYVQLVACGRILEKPAFGRLGSLLALVALATVLGNLLVLNVTRDVAGYGAWFDAGRYLRDLVAAAARRSSLVLGVLVVACPFVAQVLHARVLEVLATLAVVLALLSCCLAQGMTGGRRRLRLQAALALGGAVAKLAGTLLLLALAPSVLTALAGSSLGYLFVFLGTLLAFGWSVPRAAAAENAAPRREGGLDFRLVLAYFLAFAPFMVDQVIVQAVAPALAGDYTALATLGKIPFQAVAPVLAVVYAYLVANRLQPRVQERYFRLGSLLVLALSLTGAAVMALRPEFVVARLFSPRYLAVAPYLPAYAFAVAVFAFGHGIVLLFVARNDGRILSPLVLAFLLQLVLLLLRHDSLAALASNQVLSYGFMAAALLVRLALAAARREPRVPASAAEGGA